MTITHGLIESHVFRPDPTRLDQIGRVTQSFMRALEKAVINEEAAGPVGAMSKTILVIVLHRTIRQAGMVGNQGQIAMDCFANDFELLEAPIYGKTFESDIVCSQILPEPGPSRRINLSKDTDSNGELWKGLLDSFKEIGCRDCEPADTHPVTILFGPGFAVRLSGLDAIEDLFKVSCHRAYAGVCLLEVRSMNPGCNHGGD